MSVVDWCFSSAVKTGVSSQKLSHHSEGQPQGGGPVVVTSYSIERKQLTVLCERTDLAVNFGNDDVRSVCWSVEFSVYEEWIENGKERERKKEKNEETDAVNDNAERCMSMNEQAQVITM